MKDLSRCLIILLKSIFIFQSLGVFTPRFLCCLMFNVCNSAAQPAASPVHVQTRPQYFLLHSSLLTPLLLACSVARLARTGPGLRQLQPAASCGRRLLAKTCLGWQPKDGPTSSTASAGGAQISEAKGSNKYLDNIYKAYQSKKHCFQ